MKFHSNLVLYELQAAVIIRVGSISYFFFVKQIERKTEKNKIEGYEFVVMLRHSCI